MGMAGMVRTLVGTRGTGPGGSVTGPNTAFWEKQRETEKSGKITVFHCFHENDDFSLFFTIFTKMTTFL